MGLVQYKQKRKFNDTPEPSGKQKKAKAKKLCFVVQKHDASHLHYDFRLEMEGVLKSWAVPKGPSMNPDDKRLAMEVEDHPFDYKDFEGIIPEGNYGAGTVIVWDNGEYEADPKYGTGGEQNLLKGWKKGDLKFILHGKKLKGEFALVKMHGRGERAWLLIKKRDKYAIDDDIKLKEASVKSGKTIDEVAENKKSKKWTSSPKAKRSVKKKSGSLISKFSSVLRKSGNSSGPMPHDIKPMLATPVDEPFDHKDWIFEIKWDGYRAVAEVNYEDVNLYSRNNISYNTKFSPIVEELREMKMNAVLDGEVVAIDESGNSKFQLLQNYQPGKGHLVYYVFDMLYLNGHDMRSLPLVERKEILRECLEGKSNTICYSDHIENNGTGFFEEAQKRDLEGIIAKDKNSIYRTGKRSREWLKIKTKKRQEAVIAGFTEPRGGRKQLGAVVLGVYVNGKLKYVGHSGSGFNDKMLVDVKKRLIPLITNKNPFGVKIKTNSPVTWVKPKLVCEVEFSEWTGENNMRHPIFMGLRTDKKPEEVVREKETPVEPIIEEQEKLDKKQSMKEGYIRKTKNRAGNTDIEMIVDGIQLKISNVDKIFWPKEKYTKGDLVNYYAGVAKYMIPYLKDRPESLNRHPNGINGENFFHKDVGDKMPSWIKTHKVRSDDKMINYMLCQNKAALMYMANLGCIEINPWSSRIQNPDKPDFMIIDLDPLEISFDKVIKTALEVKVVLDKIGAAGFCKTSGATGMHIYVPLGAKYDYDQSKNFAHLIAQTVHKRIPSFTSVERMPAKRKRKVYIDFLQNRRGQTLAAPYSVRPFPKATVSAPLKWSELEVGLLPTDFTINNMQERIKNYGDLFKGVLGKGINMYKCLKKFENFD